MNKIYQSQIFILFHRIVDTSFRLIMGIPAFKRSRITENIFLGGQYNLKGLRKLEKIGVTATINMRTNSIYNETQYNSIRQLHLPTIDNTPPKMEDLITGAEFIDHELTSGGMVYIHCRQGIGRGPSMLIAYLIKKGRTYEEAFLLVKKVRVFISLKPNQILRLKELESHYKLG